MHPHGGGTDRPHRHARRARPRRPGHDDGRVSGANRRRRSLRAVAASAGADVVRRLASVFVRAAWVIAGTHCRGGRIGGGLSRLRLALAWRHASAKRKRRGNANMSERKKVISIVTPCFNEEANVTPCYLAIK